MPDLKRKKKNKKPRNPIIKAWTSLLKTMSFKRKDFFEDIKTVLDSHISSSKKSIPELTILRNVVDMHDFSAEDILIPRVDIIAVEKNVPFDDLIDTFTKYGYSRIPVYQNSLDDILGFVHVKDIINTLKKGGPLNMENTLRPVLFVSPYIKVLDLLFEMIAKKHHIAMVVDEYGGIDGLITIEDIIEEIVGDITDEHDKRSKQLIYVSRPGYLEVDARMSLSDLEEKIGYNFTNEEEHEEVETVGGLITFITGRVAVKKEVITHPSGLELQIIDADPLKVSRVGINYRALMSEDVKS